MLPLFPAKSRVMCSNLQAATADPRKVRKALFLKHLGAGPLAAGQSLMNLNRRTYGFVGGRAVQRN
jgi:hypothetical protein